MAVVAKAQSPVYSGPKRSIKLTPWSNFNALTAEYADEIADLLAKVDALEAQAAIDRRDIETLHIALNTARRIGAAMGIVMHTYRVTEDVAFEILRTASQNSNRKLRDIADDVVRTGAVPGTGG